MRYYYEKPRKYKMDPSTTYRCNHEFYSVCTLYSNGKVGLAVVQMRMRDKTVYWDKIDPWLVTAIREQDRFTLYFKEHAREPVNGIYPTVTVRKLMYALKMKPLKKETWENLLNDFT